MTYYKINLKKCTCYTFALFLFCRCGCDKSYNYKDKEEKGYYTQNAYKLDILELFKDSILTLSLDAVTKCRQKLEKRIPEWLVTGQEKKPYELWDNFYKEEIKEGVLNKLKEQAHDTTLLENYYEKLRKLFTAPVETNEKELIEAIKKLKANHTLMEAFKASIIERYNRPETIYISEAILAYQAFLSFILNNPNKNSTLFLKIRKVHADLLQWKKEGYPSGITLWKTIQKDYPEPFEKSRLYKYRENKESITQLFSIIDQLTDNPYLITYADLLERLPNGIEKLKSIIEKEIEAEETKNIKLLKTYIDLVRCLYM